MLRKDTNATLRKIWQGIDERTLDDKALHTYKVNFDVKSAEDNLSLDDENNAWLIIVVSGLGFLFSFGFDEFGLCLLASAMLFFVGYSLLKQAREKKAELLESILVESQAKWHDLISSKQYTRVNNASYNFYTTYRRRVLETESWNWSKHTHLINSSDNKPVHLLHYQDKKWYLYKDEFWLTNEDHTSDEIFYIVESKRDKKRKTVEKAKKAYTPPKTKKKKPRKKERIFGPGTSSFDTEIEEKEEIIVQESTTAWSEEELDFAVEGYVDMLEMDKANIDYDKASIITMWREGVAGQSNGPLHAKSREEIKACMMTISSVLKANSIENVAGYRPIVGMSSGEIAIIESKLIDFGILEKTSTTSKKSKSSKKSNKTNRPKGPKFYEEQDNFMLSFLSPEAKKRYTNSEYLPSSRKDHSSKMRSQSALGAMGYTTQQSKNARRIILKNAVPALGLKKVVDTIVMNVKRSKTQQNPPIDAINRWESDLEWLKKRSWRGQFKWPNYRRFGK